MGYQTVNDMQKSGKNSLKMGNSNPIIAELKALAELPCGAGQHAFFERRYRDAVPVECVPMDEAFTPEQMEIIRKSFYFRQKQCYKNASDLLDVEICRAFRGMELRYVEGYVYDPILIPIEHAFVKVGDKYVDPTFELALGMDVRRCYYCSLIEVSRAELSRIERDNGFYGEIYRTVYVRGLQGRKTAKADG